MAWSAPSTRSTGDLIDATIWNQDVKSNTEALRTGAIAIASQAANDILYASSATQIARLAAGTSGHFLKSQGSGSAPVWAAVPATTPGGSDTQIQFNNSGAFGGGAALTTDGTAVTVAGTKNAAIESTSRILIHASGASANGTTAAILFSTQLNAGRPRAAIFASGTEVGGGAAAGGHLSFAVRNAADSSTISIADEMVRLNRNGLGVQHAAWTEADSPEALIHVRAAGTNIITGFDNVADWGINRISLEMVQANSYSTAISSKMYTAGYEGSSGGTAIVFGREASSWNTFMSFCTNTGTGTEGQLAEKMRIDSAGQVGILANGATATGPDCPLTVYGNDSRMLTLDRQNASGLKCGIAFYTGNSASATAHTKMGVFQIEVLDATDGSEDARFVWDIKDNGSVAGNRMILDDAGNLTCDGTKSFDIPHPLPAMQDTHRLRYYATEGSRADLVSRGHVALVDGSATVDLDVENLQTAGTWEALTRDPQIWVSNATGWSALRGSISGATLTIEAADGTSSDTAHWLIVCDRYDSHMRERAKIDDATGRPRTEFTNAECGRLHDHDDDDDHDHGSAQVCCHGCGHYGHDCDCPPPTHLILHGVDGEPLASIDLGQNVAAVGRVFWVDDEHGELSAEVPAAAIVWESNAAAVSVSDGGILRGDVLGEATITATYTGPHADGLVASAVVVVEPGA